MDNFNEELYQEATAALQSKFENLDSKVDLMTDTLRTLTQLSIDHYKKNSARISLLNTGYNNLKKEIK